MTGRLVFLAALLSAQAVLAQAAAVPGGFDTVVTFPEPGLTRTEDGILLHAEGVRNRFVQGEPVLPVRTLLIPVPPDAEPVLDYSVVSVTPMDVPSDLMFSPAVSGGGLEVRLTEPLQSHGPSGHAVLEGVVPLAGTSVAVVSVYPALGTRPATWASAVRVSLTWQGSGRPLPVPDGHPAALIAGDGGFYWPTRGSGGSSLVSQFWGSPWARISLEASGAYLLTGEMLQQQGCEVTGVPVASLAMYTGPGTEFDIAPETSHSLEEVSLLVEDQDGDGIFDSEDTIRFLGRSLNRWVYGAPSELEWLFHRYASHNVYWLTWGGAAGQRMEDLDATPDGSPSWGSQFTSRIWLEENLSWKPAYETRSGWVWMSTEPGGSMTVTFSADDPLGPASLDIATVTSVGGNNEIAVRLNGDQVGTDNWYGIGTHLTVVPGVELETSNTLEIIFTSGPSGSNLDLDYVDIGYQRGTGLADGTVFHPAPDGTGRFLFDLQGCGPGSMVFDITDFSSPRELTGIQASTSGLTFALTVSDTTGFFVVGAGDWAAPDTVSPASPGRLLGTVTDGQRLLVVSEDLLSGVWGMDAVFREYGRLPVTATTREIYDEFGQGVTDPGAIRSAVRWGMDSWASGLGGVLLVGDGHYDFLNVTTSVPVQVPPWITSGGGSSGDCYDDYYVMVHEGAVLPEIPVARIPADNSTELGTCVAKTVTYNSGTATGTWMNRSMVIADDEWGADIQYNETMHTNDCERIAEEVLPRHLDRIKFYLIEYPWPAGSPPGPHPDKPEARADLIAALSEGQGSVIYIGHGSEDQIAHEKVLLSEDIDLLANGPRLPLSIWATCDVGHFDNPGTDAIGEDMINHPAGGSIAAVAATRGCYSYANYQLGRAILDSLYTSPDITMGEALWLAKVTESGSYVYNNRFYVLFGFPGFPLPSTDTGATVSAQGDTLWSGEANTIYGNDFPSTGLAWVELRESSAMTTYTCLGGAVIDYLRYGGTAYRGTVPVSGGQFTLDCIIPVQAEQGPWARAAASCLGSYVVSSGASDPIVLAAGSPPGDDFTGPDITMWIRGYEGVENPVVTGDVVLEAILEDSSGICFLGGEGRQLRLFVNGDGMDVGNFFSYNQGSTTTGRLVVELLDLAAGDYTLILHALDGVGNASTDTLTLETLDQDEIAITEALVYPNPGDGQRCFSFRLSSDASVSVGVYTVTGRRIRTLSSACEQGYNQIMWDGLDAEGDRPASGSYVYVIRATSEGSSVFDNETESTGILAIVRE
jgi:hypothetical protein